MPKVSVILPVYNAVRFIEEAIESVLNQTEKDLEVIIIDDGSDDGTSSLLEKFCSSRVRLITQDRLGPSVARNLGISLSNSKYIALMDADDIWLPHKLKRQVTHLDAQPEVGVSFCYSTLIDQEGELLGLSLCPPKNRIRSVTPTWALRACPISCGSAAVIRRLTLDQMLSQNVAPNHGKYFNEANLGAQDVDCWIRILLFTNYIIQGIPEILVHYRVWPDSFSAQLERTEEGLQLLRQRFAKFSIDLNFPIDDALNEAFHLRYLAQRALLAERGGRIAMSYFAQAVGKSCRLLTEDPRATFLIGGAALLSGLLPRSISSPVLKFGYRWLEQPSPKKLVPSSFCLGKQSK